MADLVKVGVSSTEKINAELFNPKLKYSSFEIGSWVETYAEDTPEARKEALDKITAELAEYMEAERSQLAEDLSKSE